MTDRTDTLDDFTACDHEHRPRKTLSLKVFGAVLACGLLGGGWVFYANLAANSVDTVAAAQTRPAIDPAEPAEPIDPNLYAALFDSRYSGFWTDTFSQSLALTPEFLSPAEALPDEIAIAQDVSPPSSGRRHLAHSIPFPTARPTDDGMTQSQTSPPPATAPRNKTVSTTAPDKPTIFEKLFGRPQTSGPTLAYAAPDGGVLGDGQSITSGRSPTADGLTAVYDISAHTVYMPDGTRLEAHSGLGSRLDDPRYVHERMRGATPPHVYELQPRERLFHGVQALRLIPVSGSNPLGRAGLLAHSYMLGPNGDSNGCVSFKNYNAFLRAYMNRKVKRLVVVARRD